MRDTPLCDECGHPLAADHDTEMGDDGKYHSWYTGTLCPNEKACCAPGCCAPTHDSCGMCGEPLCLDHRSIEHECPTCATRGDTLSDA